MYYVVAATVNDHIVIDWTTIYPWPWCLSPVSWYYASLSSIGRVILHCELIVIIIVQFAFVIQVEVVYIWMSRSLCVGFDVLVYYKRVSVVMI